MKNCKIAIVAHNCRAGGGLVGTINLLKAFRQAAGGERFLLVCSKGYGYEAIELPAGSEIYVYKDSHAPWKRCFFEEYTLPKVIRRYAPDVIFGPGPTALSRPPVPQSLFMRNPYLFYDRSRYQESNPLQLLRLTALRRQVKKSLPFTQQIFVQTPVVKQRFSTVWNYPEEQIKVIRFPCPADIGPVEETVCPAPLSDRSYFYVLFLTRYLGHRNPKILLPLCDRFQKPFRERKIRFLTTIGDHERKRAQTFLREIGERGFEDLIVNVGRLNRQEVAAYYGKAHLLWLHTFMETLCLPFLEAMKLGLPILAPDLDFSRYVCGPAAYYYPIDSLDKLAEAILDLSDHRELGEQLRLQGLQQLRNKEKFASDWTQTAADLLDSLREMVQ